MVAGQTNVALPEGLDIGRYRIVKKIAVGGSSVVYHARDASGHDVAIKEFLPAPLVQRAVGEHRPTVPPQHLDLYQMALKYFLDEGRALATIEHPNVVRVRDVFGEHGTVYLVMDYERGRSLQDHIAHRRRLGVKPLVSEAALRSVFLPVMAALREVHARRLLHLDLKPANIFLRQDGTPILLDFGSARQTLHVDLTRLHTMYTPGFAAPEMYTRRGLGPWTDIYSIGAAIFTCMVGVPPQSAIERKRDDRMALYYRELASIYPGELVARVRDCLMLDPLQRPQSVHALQKMMQMPD